MYLFSKSSIPFWTPCLSLYRQISFLCNAKETNVCVWLKIMAYPFVYIHTISYKCTFYLFFLIATSRQVAFFSLPYTIVIIVLFMIAQQLNNQGFFYSSLPYWEPSRISVRNPCVRVRLPSSSWQMSIHHFGILQKNKLIIWT